MGEAPEAKKRDWLDVLDIIGKAMVPFVVAVFGYQVNMSLGQVNSNLQKADISARQMQFGYSHQLAVSQMRWQAFDALAKNVAPTLEKDSRKVALLAGLNSCSSDLLNTRPVFETLAASITDKGARQQLKDVAVLRARMEEQALLRQGQGAQSQFETFTLGPGGKPKPSPPFTLGEHTLEVEVSQLSNWGDARDHVDVTLHLKDSKEKHSFQVSYTDSPLVDNTPIHQSNGEIHHIAVILLAIRQKGANHFVDLEFLHFPDKYLTDRDIGQRLLTDTFAKPSTER